MNKAIIMIGSLTVQKMKTVAIVAVTIKLPTALISGKKTRGSP